MILGIFERILVGYDGSDNALRAVDRAIQLAKQSNAELRIVVVVDTLKYSSYPTPGLYRQFNEEAKLNAQNLARAALDRAKAAGVAGVFASDVEGQYADKILTLSTDYRSDLIVVGRSGMSGLKRFLMGSVSTVVINQAKCDVLVVK